ncbi:hypothetical protein [Brevibacillus parabrevis]|uniref:hypothetical protein n=1 Tax=Brevibacillus parabrevis TaxID=54914 RepID=UPI000ABF253B|nr:hypothetical protein [Brevibacillus parabrevis]
MKPTLVLLLAIMLSAPQTFSVPNLLFTSQHEQMLTPEQAKQILTTQLTKNPALGPIKITAVTYSNGQYHISYTRESNCESGTHIINAYTGETVGGTRNQC